MSQLDPHQTRTTKCRDQTPRAQQPLKSVRLNGGQINPAIAGISPPSVPTMEGDAAGAAISADLEDDDAAGKAEMNALEEEDGEADVTASGAG